MQWQPQTKEIYPPEIRLFEIVIKNLRKNDYIGETRNILENSKLNNEDFTPIYYDDNQSALTIINSKANYYLAIPVLIFFLSSLIIEKRL